MRILIDISEIQFGYTGIVHDIVGIIRSLQLYNYIEITYAYFDYSLLKSDFEIDEFVSEFCIRNHLKLEKIRKFKYLSLIIPNLYDYDYIFRQSLNIGLYFRRSEKSKIILRLHDIISITHPQYSYFPLINFQKLIIIYNLYFLNKPYVYFVTNSYHTIITSESKFGKLNNTAVIPCIIEINKDKVISKDIVVKGDYILFVGSIEERKNIVDLLDAMIILNKDYPDLKLILLGKYTSRNQILLKRIENTPNVQMLKGISDLARDQIYRNAKCFLCPSIVEGFGMTPLEAMCFDIPVICSDIPVFREVQKSLNLYYKIGDIQDLVSKIKSILEKNYVIISKQKQKIGELLNSYSLTNVSKLWKQIIK